VNDKSVTCEDMLPRSFVKSENLAEISGIWSIFAHHFQKETK
jgi:hypothetical protein